MGCVLMRTIIPARPGRAASGRTGPGAARGAHRVSGMAAPTARHLALAAGAVAAVVGLGLAVAGPLTPSDPPAPSAPPPTAARAATAVA